jgi:tetratricopeptide (TPR) repeat protein
MVVPRPIAAACLILLLATTAAAQPSPERQRAIPPYEQGLEQMRQEAFDAAAKSFEAAVAIDQSFDMAYYMLGRAHLARKQYDAAVYALEQCRRLHQAESTRSFSNKQEGNRLRRERLAELDRLIEDTRAAADRPENATRRFSMLEQVRQYQERKRQIQDLDRNADLTPARAVPAFVSLSLGSAYFRSGNLAEAEKAYTAAIAADSKVGEAHNNLAVVYMETGRYDEAMNALKAAEKAGVKVHPDLRKEIERRRKS